MQTVYTRENPPEAFSKSIFLAGPTPRSKETPSWRPEALRLLEMHGYDGIVFVPENRDGAAKSNYDDQIEWEEQGLNMADCILFWVPRDLETMPALTTNVEWGVWCNSGKAVFGAPMEAERMGYLRYYAKKLRVPRCETLEGTVLAALDQIGAGANRQDGERHVPLHVWQTASFQSWYQAQKNAGNRLDSARVVWNWRVGFGRKHIFCWALHASVYVAAENRHKANEVVIGRPDVSAVVIYHRKWPVDDSLIVLVKEFRTAASTPDGFIRELPCGSSWNPQADPRTVAVSEVGEETGLGIAPERLRYHGSRQLAGTMLTHKAHLFSVELTEKEVQELWRLQGIVHGDGEERTTVEICTLRAIRKLKVTDWSTAGMALSVLEP